MRTMAPGTGTSFDGQQVGSSGIAALDRLAWLRVEPVPAPPRWHSWVVFAFLGVLVAGALAGMLTASDPLSHDARLAAAFRAQQGGDLATSAALYAEVVEADPSNAVAQFNLGVIHHTQSDVVGAMTQYEAALDADATYVPALFNLAVLRADADPAAAIDLYRRLLAVEPGHAGATMNLGLLLLQGGEAVEGSALIDQALTLDPSLQLD